MDVVRKIFLWVAGFLLGPALLIVVSIWGFNRTLGHPDYVKQVFKETQIYSEVNDFIVEEIQSQVDSSSESDLVNNVIEDTLNPQLVEGVAVNVVDEVYNILEGETDPKDFQLDISPLTNALIQNTKVRLKEHLLTLKPCNFANPPNSVNPYEFNCLPFGSDIDSYVDSAIMLTKLDNEVLRTGSINLNTMNLDDSDNSPKKEVEQNVQNLRNISSAYQSIQRVYLVAILVTLVCIGLVIFLSKQKIRGIKRVGIILIGNALVISIIAGVVMFFVNKIIAAGDTSGDPMNVFQRTGNQLVSDLAFETLKFSLIVSILGGALTLFAILQIKKQQPRVLEDEKNNSSKKKTSTV